MAGKTSLGKSSRFKDRQLFDAIRKPGAPPGHPITQAKPHEKARPAGRKAKHKRRPDELSEEPD